MELSRRSKQILKLYETRSKAKIELIKWIAAVYEDLKAADAAQTTKIYDRNTLIKKCLIRKLARGISKEKVK